AASLREAAPDDRLAGSYPFLTMTSVMVAGWLVERMARTQGADERMRAAANYFLSAIVPEAMGLGAATGAGAAMLYAVPAEALA
ncbi:MAG: acyl-CoA dehydrogenase C-terminal domain-containing protein, partial [Sphingomicrobium sp.]